MTDSPLRVARRNAEKTLAEVSEALEVKPSTLSRIERGECLPGTELLKRIVDYYGGAVTYEGIIDPFFLNAERKQRADASTATGDQPMVQ